VAIPLSSSRVPLPELAPIPLTRRLPRFHRAGPSTSLDKRAYFKFAMWLSMRAKAYHNGERVSTTWLVAYGKWLVASSDVLAMCHLPSAQYALWSWPASVCTSVRTMILISSHNDQFSTYHRSYLVRSAIDVSPRKPLTCAQPVMPAFSRWRSI
jgi:hypothetical protein